MDLFTFWAELTNININLVIGSGVLCGILKLKRGCLFSFSLAAFYVFSVLMDDTIIESDPGCVYRYMWWALIDLAFLAWIAVLVKFKAVSLNQFMASCFIEAVAISMLLIRMLDNAYSGGGHTDGIFAPVIWSTNMCYVVLAFAPAIKFAVTRSASCK